MKRILLFWVVILIAVPKSNGQYFKYYKNIENKDLIGLNINSVHKTLDSAANILVHSFPEDFRNSFRIYSVSFYLHSSEYENAVPQKVQEAIQIAQDSTEFYLVFGRETDENHTISEYWIELNLPSTGIFSCLTSTHRDILISEMKILAKDGLSHQKSFVLIEKEIMEILVNRNNLLTNCCVSSVNNTCLPCLTNDEIEILLKAKGFRSIPCSISEEVLPFRPSNSRSNNVYGRQDLLISFQNGQELNSSEILNTYLDSVSDYNHSAEGYILLDEDFCQLNFHSKSMFDSLYTDFEASITSVKVMWILVDKENTSEDVLYERVTNLEEFGEDIFLSKLGELLGNHANTASCHETQRFGLPTLVSEGDADVYISNTEGQAAHAIIEFYYSKIRAPLEGVSLEYAIPESSSSQSGNIGYADIVNRTTGEIFEIKTVRNWPRGNSEVILYIEKANKFCDKPLSGFFKRGSNFPKKIDLPWVSNNKKLIAYLDLNSPGTGVITYDLKPTNNLDKQPSPFVITEWQRQKILNVIEAMARTPLSANQIAFEFIKDNPDLIPIVVVSSVTIVLVALAAETGSFGATSLISIPMIIAGSTLAIAALDYDPNSNSP